MFASNKRAEALGLALLEAAIFAKPMVSCRLGTGTSHVNRAGVTGLVVKPGNAQHLAMAMNRIAEDPELARRFGESARKRYEKHFRAQDMAHSYAMLYREVAMAVDKREDHPA